MQGVKADLFKTNWSRLPAPERAQVDGSGAATKTVIQVNIPDNTACFVRLSKGEDNPVARRAG
ncbi:MAG: hypothetical protein IPL65_07395 [Lewinellaceae bacterium]|nr:hypothetical protein [Lewinellaceae bacterium]